MQNEVDEQRRFHDKQRPNQRIVLSLEFSQKPVDLQQSNDNIYIEKYVHHNADQPVFKRYADNPQIGRIKFEPKNFLIGCTVVAGLPEAENHMPGKTLPGDRIAFHSDDK